MAKKLKSRLQSITKAKIQMRKLLRPLQGTTAFRMMKVWIILMLNPLKKRISTNEKDKY